MTDVSAGRHFKGDVSECEPLDSQERADFLHWSKSVKNYTWEEMRGSIKEEWERY